jgi:hypothetical protein
MACIDSASLISPQLMCAFYRNSFEIGTVICLKAQSRRGYFDIGSSWFTFYFFDNFSRFLMLYWWNDENTLPMDLLQTGADYDSEGLTTSANSSNNRLSSFVSSLVRLLKGE